LHKIAKQERVHTDQAFKLHCFPDLSMDCGSGPTQAADSGYGFQKVDTGSDSCGPGDFLLGAAVENGSISESEERILEIQKQAYNQGFAEGEKIGLETGNRQLTPVIQNFTQALSQLEEIKREIRLNAEKKMLDLALAVARKVVTCEIQNNRESILHIIHDAMERVVDHKNIIIKLNPEDFKYVNDRGFELAGLIDHFEHITFEADECIVGGGCLIETKMGEIDARIDQQFKVIEERFEAEYNKAKKEVV